ncbi:MAG: ABC transporter substrate-binding protein [Dehalococcoidia bacterium]|nr:ABC transporter substrate-binding protein [Dehalococcoidia bacterium]
MANRFWMERPLSRLSWSVLGIAVLALLALACAPATQPAAAPQTATTDQLTTAVAPVAPVLEGATTAPIPGVETPKTGRYIERAGLQIFIPEGFEFGGPTIPPDPRTPRYGGIYVHGHENDPPSIDPYHTTSSQMAGAVGWVYERLIHEVSDVATDPTVDARVPGLAESWDISSDFMTYTFRLRKGVKWQNVPPVNGREMDAEDVKATFDFLSSTGSIQKGFFGDVNRVEVVDKYTVKYQMKKVNPAILGTLAEYGRGYILPREIASATTTFNRRVSAIGTGPFMAATDYEFKVGISYRRNPDYWRKNTDGSSLPYMDGVRIAIIPDNTARNTAWRTGKIDTGVTVQSPTDVRNLLRTNPTTLVQETRTAPPSTASQLGFRLDKEPWNDVRVRRALSLALDYDVISETVYEIPFSGNTAINGGWYGQPQNTIKAITEDCGCPWYTPDVKRAKQLLAEAGYPNGFSTTLEYSYTRFTPVHELQAAMWKEIGVTVLLKTIDYTVWRANLDKGAWTDLNGWSFIFPYPSTLDGAMTIYVAGRGGNSNSGWVNDQKLTNLITEFEASYKDIAKQKELIKQARAYYLDQVLSIPEARAGGFNLFSPRLRNYQPVNHLILSSSGQLRVTRAWIDNDWAFNK